MSDIKLFRTNGDIVTQLHGQSVALEKSLQLLIEKHLEALLGIRFLASEYTTGKTHAGRIDTLGIDENWCPCILEYKRSSNENVISQGLFYMDWLLDHKAEFELLVLKKYGAEEAKGIVWSDPRLLCIAGNFTKYDVHAVQQINRNIELLRYQRFGDELLMLELINAVQASMPNPNDTLPIIDKPKAKSKDKTFEEQLALADQSLVDLYEELTAICLNLGDDVQIKMLKLYVAFKRLKNFVSAEVRAGAKVMVLYLKVNPDSIAMDKEIMRDVRKVGHWGTGDLEITIRNREDLAKSLPLIQASYEAS